MNSTRELIVDSFAGGGGASLGITLALGRGPDLAINHDAAAIAMHAANHPDTKHFTEDVWRVSPHTVTKGRAVGLLWASPDCRHFSRAKGAKPVSKKIRSLAWVVIKWAAQVRPRMIILENVREFQDWGPLLLLWRCDACDWRGTEGQAKLARRRRRCPRCDSLRLRETEEQIPDPDRKGLTFKRWAGRLRNMGYKVEWKSLNAADYGAPTHRRRLFLIARCDGQPIIWPEPTHADPSKINDMPLFGQLQPYRTAAECIDWSIPCKSIFDRPRPLADKTLRRIALGLKRYVLDNPKPFIVQCNHAGEEFRGQSINEPMPTLTASRDAHGLITPYLSRVSQGGGNGKYTNSPEEPLTTIVSKAEHLLVAPTLIQTGYGERPGQAPRAPGLDKPLGTAVAGGQKHALVSAFISQYFGNGVIGKPPSEPLPTITAWDHNALTTATLIGVGGRAGQSPPTSPTAPVNTCTAKADRAIATATLIGVGGSEYAGKPKPVDQPKGTVLPNDRTAVIAANMVRFNHGEKQWNGADEPVSTVTTQANKHALAATTLVRFNHDDNGIPVEAPLPTTTSNNHCGLVYAFLSKYYGNAVGQGANEPLGTTTAKHRFGVVTVEVAPGQIEQAVAIDVPNIGPCIIADIGLRMLTPRELARAQGFPDTYHLTGSKANQVAKIGNSVCPVLPKVLIEANYQPQAATKKGHAAG